MTTSIVLRPPSTCTTCPIVTDLRAQLDAAYRDPIWGIYSRQGIERRMAHLRPGMATIVIDIDHMHDCNTTFGHDGVDARVASIFQAIRAEDAEDMLIGRWLRGDEVVIFVHQDDAIGLARRLLGTFRAYAMSATAALVWRCDTAGIKVGCARIEVAKEAGERGRIFIIEGGVA